MGKDINKVIAGHFKNNEILLKSENKDEIAVVINKLLGKKELPMDKTTIKRFTHSLHSLERHEIIIEWNDGKMSQAIVDDAVYSELCAKLKA